MLNVVVRGQPYEVMHTGEKNVEYRENTGYRRKRLLASGGEFKPFTHVHIAEGYGAGRREFLATCRGLVWLPAQEPITFSTGWRLDLDHAEGYVGVLLGDIVWHRTPQATQHGTAPH